VKICENYHILFKNFIDQLLLCQNQEIMLIQKFGGTSVGTPQRMRDLAEIIMDDNDKLIVLSAVAGTTNKLLEISVVIKNGYLSQALNRIYELRKEYEILIH
jgi:aspartate kinase